MKGAYLLILKLQKDTRIPVGQQGVIPFRKGAYGYIGSALNGLEQRVERHQRSQKNIHWHVDYLLTHATITNVFIKESVQKEECDLAHHFNQAFEDVPGFGCSDCDCESHLFIGSVEALTKHATFLKMKPYPLDANP